jgi:methanogenic corrinoid protein MtbC1
VFPATAQTVEFIKKAGLRNGVKIMVGGGPVTNKVAKETGCDYFGIDAIAALNYTKEIYNL